MRGIKTDPAQILDAGFCPRVFYRRFGNVPAQTIAADAARGNLKDARAGDEKMRKIMAKTRAAGKGCAGGRHVPPRFHRRRLVQAHRPMDGGEESVKPIER